METIPEVTRLAKSKAQAKADVENRERIDGGCSVWETGRRCWGQTGTAIKEKWGQAVSFVVVAGLAGHDASATAKFAATTFLSRCMQGASRGQEMDAGTRRDRRGTKTAAGSEWQGRCGYIISFGLD